MTKIPKLNRQKVLTVREVAQELRISTWLVNKLIRENQLKTFTIATRRLTTSDDLDSFIKEQKEKEYET